MARRTLLALAASVAIAVPLIIAPHASAAKNNYGVVVVHGDNSVDTECVRLSANQVRAFDLLQETSFDFFTVSFGNFGRSVCYVDGEGYLPPASCFNPAPGEENWGLWFHRRKNAPRLANVGLSALKVRPKGVIYLVFREFEPPNFVQDPPARLTVKTICS